jgi:RNA ligase
MVMHNNRLGFDSIKSGFSVKKDVNWDHMNKFEPYDKLVEQGFLRKQESGDLVLYNYNEKCTYEKHWNNYTMECRGLILDKNTGDTVARPFPKFFNVGELASPQLPKIPVGESYDVYEKVDGSLGILYYHPNEQMWKIATRGSFESDQAKKATLMFRKVVKGIIKDDSHTELYVVLLNKYPHYKDYTLCFEIIYPENRMNDGARLVCDYGTKETLILLGGIHKVTGKDLDYGKLTFISAYLCLPLAKKYTYTIEQLMEMKKTLPMQEEGWVVRFENGFRVKVKGDEYCKMARILNSINPLSIWEVMKENKVMSNRLELPYVYKMNLPEELLPEVNYLESKIKELFLKAYDDLRHEFAFAYTKATNEYPDNIKKGLGLQLSNLKHRSAIFPYYENKWQAVNNYVMMYIRPKGNEFNE